MERFRRLPPMSRTVVPEFAPRNNGEGLVDRL